MKEEEIQKIITNYEKLMKLKILKRQGWINWNIQKDDSESIADHIYGSQILAWCIYEVAKPQIDIYRVIAMLSLHETEEVEIGDITPFDHVTKEEKKKRGKEAVDNILKDLGQMGIMKQLIEEFEAEETEEAKFAKMCDKLECDLQARAYENEGLIRWNKAPEEVKNDSRVQKIRKQGVYTIQETFLENDYPYFENKIFQDIGDYMRRENKKKRKVAIVLEGGALRGIYSAGVLDALLESDIDVQCLIGVSAGALNGMNYISNQKGRSAKINIEYCNDPQYIGRKAIARSKGIIGFDYLFEDISKKLIPFDEKTFTESKKRFIAVATNCATGEAEYFEKDDYTKEEYYKIVQASSSMPLASAVVKIGQEEYLDGAVADSVPVKWAIEQGYEKIIVILTRDQAFRKKLISNRTKQLYRVAFKKYPKLMKKLYTMPERYNKLREEMDKLQKEGKIYIIRPEKKVTVARLEKDKEKLKALYEEGYQQTKSIEKDLKEYIESEDKK